MVRHQPTELEPLVSQFQHLANMPRAKDALETLRKVASLVKPIMRRRSWAVGTLCEFYPAESNLLGLNINHGEKICLRLRYPGDESQFLPFENVVDTMLHELSHIEVGPHNAAFQALWDQLRDEHETLIRKGYTGEGFLGRGERLGGRRVPMDEARRLARAAAERRRTLTQNSGSRLGGTGIRRGENARDIIANAVERRNRIQRGCASDTDQGAKLAREQQARQKDMATTVVEREDENEANALQAYIELIEEEEKAQYGKDYVGVSASNPAGSRGRELVEQQRAIEKQLERERPKATTRQRPPSASTSTVSRPSPASSRSTKTNTITATTTTATTAVTLESSASASASTITPPTSWTCSICTLINDPGHLACDACGVERPAALLPGHASTSSTGTESPRHPSLQPRRTAYENASRFSAQSAAKSAARPMGWTCACGNWMEDQWWTCALCGRMKSSS